MYFSSPMCKGSINYIPVSVLERLYRNSTILLFYRDETDISNCWYQYSLPFNGYYYNVDGWISLHLHVIFGRWQVPLASSATEIIKALSETYKMLFYSSKNIVPSRSYRCLEMDVYIRDRAFPVTRLPAPILVRMSWMGTDIFRGLPKAPKRDHFASE